MIRPCTSTPKGFIQHHLEQHEMCFDFQDFMQTKAMSSSSCILRYLSELIQEEGMPSQHADCRKSLVSFMPCAFRGASLVCLDEEAQRKS